MTCVSEFLEICKKLDMSLIVARRFENELCITCDTKLYYPSHETKGLKSHPKEGTIKTVIISDNICMSFAGGVAPTALEL